MNTECIEFETALNYLEIPWLHIFRHVCAEGTLSFYFTALNKDSKRGKLHSKLGKSHQELLKMAKCNTETLLFSYSLTHAS